MEIINDAQTRERTNNRYAVERDYYPSPSGLIKRGNIVLVGANPQLSVYPISELRNCGILRIPLFF